MPCYPNYNFGNFTTYPVYITNYTPKYNIRVDDPRHELNPAKLDQTIYNVSECVHNIADTGFTKEEFVGGECYNNTIDANIRSCLTIKTAPDWMVSSCTGEQIFPCNIGEYRCQQKDATPIPQCPCSCRAIIQDGNVLIITPNLRLLPAYLTTMMTGCLSPWVGRLAECSASSQIAK